GATDVGAGTPSGREALSLEGDRLNAVRRRDDKRKLHYSLAQKSVSIGSACKWNAEGFSVTMPAAKKRATRSAPSWGTTPSCTIFQKSRRSFRSESLTSRFVCSVPASSVDRP